MSTSAGTSVSRIGAYPVERELGRGGMGVVYLARDMRLDRAVAIKVLPDDLAHDAERLARFEREARILASLHHPNIAMIYGLEDADGRRFLVLEYVEGDTLAQRLARGPLPVEEALEVCRQIATGLEAAHEGGVVHRDLKPANVKLTPGGEVKVLDFGLAKGGAGTSGLGPDQDLSHSPTLAYSATQAGLILGTAAYMSPEQARGRAVDRRTDIWSFGCVLYECLTGRQLFAGETVSDTIAKILEREPDWSTLPPQTPAKARELLQHCLDKDAKRRLRDIGDARLQLDEALVDLRSGRIAAAGTQEKERRRGGMSTFTPAALAAGAVIGAIAGVALWNGVGPGAGQRARAETMRLASHLSVALPTDVRFGFADLLQDGSALIALGEPRAQAGSDDAQRAMYIRRLDSYDVKPIAGTEGALGFQSSQDGRWLYFIVATTRGSAKAKLMRAPIDGGAPPSVLTDWQDNWNDMVVLGNGDLLIMEDQGTRFVRVPASGGDPAAPIAVNAGSYRGTLSTTSVLPEDRGVLMNGISYGAKGWYYRIGLLDPKTGKVRFLLDDGGNAVYSPTGDLLFTRGDVLMAARFDLGRLALTGPTVPILNGLLTRLSVEPAKFDLARNGTLMFRSGGTLLSEHRLAVVDLGGVVKPWSEERRAYNSGTASSLSRDGRRFATTITNADGIDEVWLSDFARPALRRVVAVPDADCDNGPMTPDGNAFTFSRTGHDAQDGVYLQRVDGATPARRILVPTSPSAPIFAAAWSPDGSALLSTVVVDGRNHLRIQRGLLASESAPPPKPLLSGFLDEFQPAFSPDGQRIAFASNESGKPEVWVCTYKAGGAVGDPVRVSNGGGANPAWAPDGKRLLYLAEGVRLMSVPISGGTEIEAGAATQVLDLEKLDFIPQTVLPDGRFFGVLTSPLERTEVTGVNLVLGFFDELKRKVAAAR